MVEVKVMYEAGMGDWVIGQGEQRVEEDIEILAIGSSRWESENPGTVNHEDPLKSL